MKYIAAASILLSTLSSTSGFVPTVPHSFAIRTYDVCLDAKHVQNKATKKHRKRRPKKSRPSDINRAKVEYPAFVKPPEYTLVGEPAAFSRRSEMQGSRPITCSRLSLSALAFATAQLWSSILALNLIKYRLRFVPSYRWYPTTR